MNTLPQSLSVRLLLIFIASALVILLVLSVLFSYGISTEWRQQIRPHLAQYVRYVRSDLGTPPSIERADEIAAALPVDLHIFQSDQLLHSTNNRVFDPAKYKFTAQPGKPDKRGDQDVRLIRAEQNERVRRSDREGPSAHKTNNRRSPMPPVEFARNRHHAIVKLPMHEYTVYVELDRKIGSRTARRTHLFLLPIVLVALLGILYALLRRLLSPISEIKTGVATMTAGNLDHRIPVNRQDDLGELASSVNGLSARIQNLLDAKRELLLSVSHELRSPITRANLAATMMPKSKYRTEVLEDLNLLDSLIESLMESERLQSEHSALNISSVDIKSVLINCVDDVKAEHKDEIGSISIECDKSVNTIIEGDEVRLRLMCRNLLNNAVVHGKSPEHGSVPDQLHLRINLNATADEIELNIADRGRGVANSELASLTEAFYRTDPSRAHGTGGVGLGLSLAQLIAEAHGGSLSLAHNPDGAQGLSVTVQLKRFATQAG